MGFSKYPNELDDSTTLPPAVDLVTPVKAEAVNRLRDAILVIEAELGIVPSNEFGTVKARLNQLRADLSSIENELGINPSGNFSTVVERLNNFDDGVFNPVFVSGVAGSETIDITTYTTIGSFTLDPSQFLDNNRIITWEVNLRTSLETVEAQIKLFNLTDGADVADSVLTSTATTLENLSVVLTDIPNSKKTYEVLLRMGSFNSTEFVECNMARLVMSF